MLNKITIGISQALNAEFGDGVKNHIDDVEQGLVAPCFLITPLTPTETHLLGKRYERRYPFVLQYFPENMAYRAECNEKAEKLFNILEYITADGLLIHGTNMEAHVVDGVLNFEVTYKMHIIKKREGAEGEDMENLELEASLKE